MADEPIADANVLIFFENQLTYTKKHKESPQEPVYTGCLRAYVVCENELQSSNNICLLSWSHHHFYLVTR